jgi:ferric iron reductase protein FhuF
MFYKLPINIDFQQIPILLKKKKEKDKKKKNEDCCKRYKKKGKSFCKDCPKNWA